MKNIVFLLEELSMKIALESILPRVLPNNFNPIYVVHQGKHDLEKSIPRKLRADWPPNTRFVVLRDQDSGDCIAIKDRLTTLCMEAGRDSVLIRIACRELESWFLGDLKAVETGLHRSGLARQQQKVKFRTPDKIGSPSQELKKLVSNYQKVGGARAIAPHLDLDNNRSCSFRNFLSGIQKHTTDK